MSIIILEMKNASKLQNNTFFKILGKMWWPILELQWHIWDISQGVSSRGVNLITTNVPII